MNNKNHWCEIKICCKINKKNEMISIEIQKLKNTLEKLLKNIQFSKIYIILFVYF